MQIVTPTRPTVKPVNADRDGKVDAYWTGFNNFCDGQTLEAQPTFQHRNGWMWALSRQAECECGGSR